MKKLLFVLLILIYALRTVEAQYVSIPDPTFRSYLQSKFPNCFIGNMMDTTCNDLFVPFDSIDVRNMGITDLTGIQYIEGAFVFCSNNLLTSLPSLAKAGSHIDCSHNQLTSITALPETVHYFDCSYNNLTSLPADTVWWAGAWTQLYCSHNLLNDIPPPLREPYIIDISYNNFTSVPPLGPAVHDLNCSNNFITGLLDMSNLLYMSELNCSNNAISTIAIASSYVMNLDCSNNQLTSFPTGLTVYTLDCSDNLLTALPIITGFNVLDCSNNNISTLGLSPTNSLDVSGNPISCLPPLSSVMYNLQTANTNITCIPNHPPFLPTTLPVCYPAGTGSCSTFPLVSGTIFRDYNSNGIQDTSDAPLPEWVVTVQPYNWLGVADSTGYYQVQADSGINVDLTIPDPISPYCTITPASYTFLFNSMNVSDTANDFAVSIPSGINDLRVFYTGNPIVPGDTAYHTILAANVGSTILNATVVLYYPDTLQFLSATPTVNVQTPGVLAWNIPNFEPFDQKNFQVTLAAPTTLTIGDPINILSSILPVSGDSVPSDNTSGVDEFVVGSYDPNDKQVNKPEITPSDVADEVWLNYTIRFQNTGTYYANNILISDTLGAGLQMSSLQVTGYSHAYEMSLSGHGILEFRFRNIQLPSVAQSEPLSHGYISFRIRVSDTLLLADEIHNSAAIYFDFNVPVITNTAITTVVLPSALPHITSYNDFELFPNPASDALHVRAGSDIISLKVFSIRGEELQHYSSTHSRDININTSGLIPGLYILRAACTEGIFYGKFIRQ